MKVWVVVLLVVMLGGAARADVTLEALGSVPVAANDSEAARKKALDDAFRQAVDQVIGTLVTPETRKAQSDVIKKRVLRRAKVYVTQHRVIAEGEDGGVYQVHIEATVADGVLKADLKALSIPVIGEEAVEPKGGPVGPVAAGRPKLAVLVTGAAEGAALGDGLVKALAARGWQASVLAASETPVDDGEAARRARAAGAPVVIVLAVEARDGGRVRGTRLHGAEIDLVWRVVDDTGEAGAARVAEGRVSQAGVGAQAGDALAGARAAAGERTWRELAPALAKRWSDAPRPTQGLLVWVRGVERWTEVAATLKAIAAVPGVDRVVVLGLRAGEVQLVVLGRVDAEVVGRALASTPLGSVRAGSGLVQLDLAPPPPPAEVKPVQP